MEGEMTITLTNDHMCSHTDGGKSTYVFHTSPVIVFPESVNLQTHTEALERVSNRVEFNRD